MTQHCAVCGVAGEHLDPVFIWPDAVLAIPEDEQEERVERCDDFVRIDGEVHFIRALLPIPVVGLEQGYRWGFWVRVAREQFLERHRYFGESPPRDHPGFVGTLANQARRLPPTLGLPVHVHLGRGGRRPSLMLLDDDHPLARQQVRGITLDEAQAWSEQSRPASERGPDPRVPPFTPSLPEDGWRILSADEVGSDGVACGLPLRPGDAAKVAIAFQSASPHGEVVERTECLWVWLREVREDGWSGGWLENSPSAPGCIGSGSCIWLRPEQLLAVDLASDRPPPPAPRAKGAGRPRPRSRRSGRAR